MSMTPKLTPARVQQFEQSEARLNELEETLRAIRQGEADAVVVATSQGDRVFTLQGADHPYRVMVEAINEGAATLSVDGLILYANRRLAEMVEVPLEKLIGSALNDIVQVLNCSALEVLLQAARTSAQKEECNLLVTGGKLLPAYLSLSPLTGDDFQGICMIATDLTDQKVRQEELGKANEQLRSEIRERNRIENALRQLTGRLLNLQDEERRRIARDLHDSTAQTLNRLALNLAYIESQSQQAGDSGAPKLLRESMALAEQASKEIRDLSHLLYPPALDEMGLVAAIQWHAARTSEVTGIKVKLDLPAEVPRLPRETEVALFRVLQESLENVRRHSGSPVAEVRLKAQEDNVLLEIIDEGHGAPAGLLNGSGGSVTGLGVGVAGMRERLRQLGGLLEVESGPTGTIVRATVPASARTDAESSRRPGSSLGVLIVDDSPLVRRSVRELLSADPLLAILGEAADGREAIQKAVELQPDIVLLDLSMPMMDGLEAGRKMGVVVPHVRILAFSQDDSRKTVQEARTAGALGYVLKSDAARDLMTAVRAVGEGRAFLSSSIAQQFGPA
jgi:PAS domain S-box-containing protein